VELNEAMGSFKDLGKFKESLQYLKEKEEQVTCNTNGMEIIPFEDRVSVSVGGGELYTFACGEALTQFLTAACGPHASSTWQFSLDKSSSIQDDILNALNKSLADNKKDVVFHSFGKSIAGVTSEKYSKIYDIDAMIPFSSDDFQKQFRAGNIGFNRTSTLYEMETFKPKKIGDEFGFGIRLVNNQWGRKGLIVSAYVMRLKCTNGAWMKENEIDFNCRHVGADVMNRFLGAIAKTSVAKNDFFNSISASQESFVKKPDSVIDSVLRRVGKKRAEKEVVDELALFRREIGETGPISYYSIANAISAVGVKKGDENDAMQQAAGLVYAMVS
jgi:hypothetical protein